MALGRERQNQASQSESRSVCFETARYSPLESFGHRGRLRSANATTGASCWTTKPTCFSVVFMGLSPFLVVGFAATPMWLGPDLLRATRVCADKHSSFLRFSNAQL
jgi:hypothetical protein